VRIAAAIALWGTDIEIDAAILEPGLHGQKCAVDDVQLHLGITGVERPERPRQQSRMADERQASDDASPRPAVQLLELESRTTSSREHGFDCRRGAASDHHPPPSARLHSRHDAAEKPNAAVARGRGRARFVVRRTGSVRLWRPCGANPRYLGGIKPADAGGDRHGGAGTFIEVEAIAAKIALATRPPGKERWR
jgi:hypothetical protein